MALLVFFAAFPLWVGAATRYAEPIYGTVTRSSPFKPDPTEISVTAGGEVNARDMGIGDNCRGMIVGAAPLVRLEYTAGSLPLQIWVQSSADTTLVIRRPNGRWSCDDDSLAKNPAVRFATPQSGTYDIWVGAYGTVRPPAKIFITER